MPKHRQGCSTPREAGIWHPQGGVPRPPDALPDACDAPASPHIGRLSGRPWDAVVWLPYVGFYPLRRHEAAVGDDRLAGDHVPVARAGGQEDRGAGDVVGLAEATERIALYGARRQLGVFPQGAGEVGGEPVELLSRQLGVEIFRLEQWREKALAGIDASLKERKGEPVKAELDIAMKRIGELIAAGGTAGGQDGDVRPAPGRARCS